MDIRTERLRIRPWRHDEAQRLLDIQSRVEVMRWLGDGEPVLMRDLDQAHTRIETYAARSVVPPLGAWAVEVLETGQVAGTVLLLTVPNAEAGEVEIGWHLHPDSWRHGYATEAAGAVLGHGFGYGLPEVLALTHLDNGPSQAVARRLGLRSRGVVDKWYAGPSALFAITAEEWRAARS
ncbi:GNAT family N-acetyltransferase [Nocardioides pantholopis]|uniref:GNAT family N-acetyltransferase n=1 Tax=Nocardioides pantholopis TaxID=2483798 RepID=UPI000F08069C|nr:GNAT family N-acetyltransferase [Nocardioides pantholopis]